MGVELFVATRLAFPGSTGWEFSLPPELEESLDEYTLVEFVRSDQDELLEWVRSLVELDFAPATVLRVERGGDAAWAAAEALIKLLGGVVLWPPGQVDSACCAPKQPPSREGVADALLRAWRALDAGEWPTCRRTKELEWWLVTSESWEWPSVADWDPWRCARGWPPALWCTAFRFDDGDARRFDVPGTGNASRFPRWRVKCSEAVGRVSERREFVESHLPAGAVRELQNFENAIQKRSALYLHCFLAGAPVARGAEALRLPLDRFARDLGAFELPGHPGLDDWRRRAAGKDPLW